MNPDLSRILPNMETDHDKAAVTYERQNGDNLSLALDNLVPIQIEFEDIFVEPKGTQTFPAARVVYSYTKVMTYNLFNVFLTVILAFIWGIIIAILAFLCTWLLSPIIRIVQVCAMLCGRMYATFIRLFCDPINYSCGLIFSRCRHRYEFKPYPLLLREE